MDIYLDGKRLDDSAVQARTVADLLAALRSADADRLVVAIRFNGEAPAGAAMEALRGAELAQAGTLELETESARQLAGRTLAEVSALLEQTRGHHSAVGELLAGGRTVKAMELLTASFSVWNAAEDSLQKASRLVGLDLDRADQGRHSPARMIRDLRDHLQRLKQGLQSRDFVAVGDLVEYEMPPLTEGWQQMLAQLQETLRSRSSWPSA